MKLATHVSCALWVLLLVLDFLDFCALSNFVPQNLSSVYCHILLNDLQRTTRGMGWGGVCPHFAE